MAFLSIRNVSLSMGGPLLMDKVNLNIEDGERVCLVGRNGAGKSTLMKMISGQISPDSGEVAWQKGARAAYLPQEVPDNIKGRVFDIVAAGLPSGETPEDHQVDAILMRLGLDSEVDFSTLSGGLKRRVLLARALACEPDLLLLDEPTNHLDIESILWMEEFLLRYARALLFVTHDRQFLQKLATRIVEIDRGNLQSWECTYDLYLERKAASLEVEEKQNALFDKKLAQEEVWVRKGLKARTTRNEGRVRELEKLRLERSERRNVTGTVRMQTQESDRSGHRVAEAKNATFGYGDKPIVQDLSTLIMRGDKVGIIGPNGSGKTTLIKLLLGQLQPQSGEVKQGTRMQVAYFDQLRSALEEDQTVRYNVAGENDTVLINGERRHIIGYLQEFLFAPERARSKVSVLSGGERNRLLLAKLFTQPSNVLVMDEPTNDLDVETLDLLEDLLVSYPGTLLLVSHDRAFLNNVATSTLAPIGEGRWREYIGGYDDWLVQSQRLRATEKSTVESSMKSAKQKSGENKAADNAPARPRKMSFKETRELESLPGKIETLEAEQAALVEKMADPEFYKGDAAQTKQAQNRLTQLDAELAEAYMRWGELESFQESSA
ncbi:MAG TPA: ATP-binding cassette domain-containing protein [Abditibacteriaceae bacterium]|jgi:ATP-binding cassette subfamily F protein uup